MSQESKSLHKIILGVGGIISFLFLAVSLLFAPAAHAASTITATTCKGPDVQAAINTARDGDTVAIPAGTCTWTTQVVVTGKGITLQGAGIGQTTIVDQVDDTCVLVTCGTMLRVTTDASDAFTLTGFTFDGGPGDVDKNNRRMVVIGGQSGAVRTHRNRFLAKRSGVLEYNGGVRGVIDHNTFDSAQGRVNVYVMHGSWQGVNSYGDNSWATPAPLGTREAVFLEDNICTAAGTHAHLIDGWAGQRVVIRHNTLNGCRMTNHGTESAGRSRSGRSMEIYENDVKTNPTSSATRMLHFRGGTGVFWNNTLIGNFTAVVSMSYLRSAQSFAPWGICNGSSGWDKYPYPCLDQPGRGQGDLIHPNNPPSVVAWPNQALEPLYIWNNTINGAPGGSGVDTAAQPFIKVNRDYYLSAKPGYIPYTYPHPLTLTTGTVSPSAPTNLRPLNTSSINP